MYIELHAASAFSFLQGASLPEAIVERAANLGYEAIALVDRDGVYGAPRFYKAARTAGIKAIVGAELTLADAALEPASNLDAHNSQSLQSAIRNPQSAIDLAPSRSRRLAHRLPEPVPPDHAHEAACAERRGRAVVRRSRRLGWRADRDHRAVSCCARAATASAGCWIASNGIFGRDNVYVELQRHFDRDEEIDNESLIDLAQAYRVPLLVTNGVRFSQPDERPLFDVFTCLHQKTTLAAAGRRLVSNAERYLKSPEAMAGLFADRPGGRGGDARAGRSARVHDGRSRLSLSRVPVPPGETMISFLRRIAAGRRARSLSAVSRSCPRADRPRTGSDREARSCRLLPDRLGSRQLLPAARHSRSGPWLGGQQRRLLQPGHHGRRSGQDGSAVRALSLGGAWRMARHRSRSAERRSPRAGDPVRLRALRQAGRGDDGQRHHLSQPQRDARDWQGAGLRRSVRRSAREVDEPLRVHR